MRPLYLVTTIFNPRRFESRINLYRNFSTWVERAGVKLVTVEVAFGERPFDVTSNQNPFHIQLRTKHEMWHKERALNLGMQRLSQLVPDWQYIGWVDADIKLARDDWAEETVHLLQHYAVIQMFGQARILGPDGEAFIIDDSIGKNFHNYGRAEWGTNPGLSTIDPYVKRGHPGMAWAFRRDELNDVGGWLDVCINGSGDLHMLAGYSGNPQLTLSPKASPGYRTAILRYGELCNKYVRQNISFMPGACDHYWHGRISNRGYDDRWKMVDKHQFDPFTDLIQDVQGLYKWNLADPRVMKLATSVRKSLAARNEDTNERK